MRTKTIFTTMLLGAMFVGCQQNSYRIEGSGDAIKEGDTLFLTTDLTELTPTDTIIAKAGKFEISGETDSTFFCLLYSASDNHLAVPFFVEPGTIKMDLPADEEKRRVAGTQCNTEWQIVCDTMALMSKEMSQLASQMFSGNMEEQAKKQEQMQRLNERFKDFIYKTAKRNITNEFGYFVLTFYNDEVIPADRRKELIDMLPAALSQRPKIQEIAKMLENLQNTAEGAQINDFTMSDIDGKQVSLLDEAKKNKLTVIDFWASWCGPCRKAMPQVVALYTQYHDKGLGIIGISLDNDKEAWVNAVKELGITWTQLSDLQGWNNAIAQAFNIRAIPHMMVIDQQGRIVKNDIQAEELEQFLAAEL